MTFINQAETHKIEIEMHVKAIIMASLQLSAPRKDVSLGHGLVPKILPAPPFWCAIFQIFGMSLPTLPPTSDVRLQMVLGTVIEGTREPTSYQVERNILYQGSYFIWLFQSPSKR
jgi:hypothetical protein